MNKSQEFYSIRTFCERAGFSRQWLQRLRSEERGPPIVKVSAPKRRPEVLLPKAGADAWLAQYRSREGTAPLTRAVAPTQIGLTPSDLGRLLPDALAASAAD